MKTADTLVIKSIIGDHGPSGPKDMERKLTQCGSLWGDLEVGFLTAAAKLQIDQTPAGVQGGCEREVPAMVGSGNV